MFEDHAYFVVQRTILSNVTREVRLYDVGVCMTYTHPTEVYEWFPFSAGRVLREKLTKNDEMAEERCRITRLQSMCNGDVSVVMSSEIKKGEKQELRRDIINGLYRIHGIEGGKTWHERDESKIFGNEQARQRLEERYKNMKINEAAVIARYKELDNGLSSKFKDATEHLNSLNVEKARLKAEKTGVHEKIREARERVQSFGTVARPI